MGWCTSGVHGFQRNLKACAFVAIYGLSKFRLVPFLIVTPLIFLGGSFYSVDMLPPFWQTATLFNPVVYLISGFRWSFYGIADVSVGVSLAMTVCFLAICLVTVWWIFKTGYRPKT